jgi:hypothetical protein
VLVPTIVLIAPYLSDGKVKSLGENLKQMLTPVVNSAKDVSDKSSNLIGRK